MNQIDMFIVTATNRKGVTSINQYISRQILVQNIVHNNISHILPQTSHRNIN